MRRTLVPLAGLCVLSSVASSGDYWLTVANDPKVPCARPTQEASASLPVASSQQIADDVARYFAGRHTQVGLFRASFSNGRVTFCGPRERTDVYVALIRAASTAAKANQVHLFDFSLVLGSQELLGMINERLNSTVASKGEGERLSRMRVAVERGMKLRGERLPASNEKPKQPAA